MELETEREREREREIYTWVDGWLVEGRKEGRKGRDRKGSANEPALGISIIISHTLAFRRQNDCNSDCHRRHTARPSL